MGNLCSAPSDDLEVKYDDMGQIIAIGRHTIDTLGEANRKLLDNLSSDEED